MGKTPESQVKQETEPESTSPRRPDHPPAPPLNGDPRLLAELTPRGVRGGAETAHADRALIGLKKRVEPRVVVQGEGRGWQISGNLHFREAVGVLIGPYLGYGGGNHVYPSRPKNQG